MPSQRPRRDVRISWRRSRPAGVTWKYRLAVRVGGWLGDVPRDYLSLFRELGYEPELESLGGFGSYQYLGVTRS